MEHETTVVEKTKTCPRCGQKSRADSSKCPHCDLGPARQASNQRHTVQDPTAVHRTKRVPVPEAMVQNGALGEVWVEVVPSRQGGLVCYRVEIRVTGFADGVDAMRVIPSPTQPNHGYSNLGQAIGVADAWAQAMEDGLTP